MQVVKSTEGQDPDARQPLLSDEIARYLVARATAMLEEARNEARRRVADSGLEVAQDYTRAVDKTVLFLWSAVREYSPADPSVFDRIALVAQGGYGRGELNFYSDIDLLAILPTGLREVEERAVRQLFHLLWDLHLDVGHATKTVSQCLETLGTDIDSATALIEARFLVGNADVFATMRSQFEQQLRRKQRKWFLEFRRRDWDERHHHYGSSVYLLEPNVKQGEGGLRDVHTLRWLEFVLYGTTSLEGLNQNGLLSASEREALLRGTGYLLRVRNQLHLIEGRKCDVLGFEKQPLVARALGYKAEGDWLAEEAFMRDYYMAAREIFRIAGRVVSDLTEPSRRRSLLRREIRLDDNIRCRGNEVYAAGNEAAYFREDPGRLVAIFAAAVRYGCRVSETTRRAIEQVIAAGVEIAPASDGRVCQAFRSLLASPGQVGATLRDMHECGVLELCLPEFRRLFCMVRADSYHRYTVDEHLLQAVEVADQLRAGGPGTPEPLRREAQDVRRWDLLYLALLLHDIGKGEGHGHVLRGGQIAQRVAARLHLERNDAEVVRRLVLDHLKLSHIALRRDIEDPKLIERVARDIGDADYLRMLYILTYCDLRAVSPDNWTEWKAVLMAELYQKTAAVLVGVHTPRLRSATAHDRLLETVRSYLTASEQKHSIPLEVYLAELPERYIATTPSDQIAHHYEMLDNLEEENRVIWELHHPPGANYSELTVVTYDRPGVFSVLCGALASKRINILGAQIFSTTGGGVIDRFQVQDIRGQPLPEGFVLERLRNDVNRIFCGKQTVEQLFGDIPREPPVHRPDLKRIVPPSIIVDNDISDSSTVIEVKGYDRLGLLYDVTQVFLRHGLDIKLALIATEAYRVVDVFYMTDAENNKLDDPATIESLRGELLVMVSK